MQEAGKPLTVELLREMDGKPVKVVYDEAAKKTTPGFEPLEMICLVEYVKSAGCVVLRNNVGGESEYYNDKELEQDGLTAYPYHPPRLDRSAWEPCKLCKYTPDDICRKCQNEICNAEYRYPCTGCNDQSRFKAKRFCQNCGRPLTEEAWAELEGRVQE